MRVRAGCGIAVLLVALFAGCSGRPAVNLEMPPGYALMCSSDGYHTFRDERGHIGQHFASRSKLTAIQNAWYWHEHRDDPIGGPPSSGVWEDCK
jgi:hypothetical protein